jgi:hypothetical protein
MDITLTELKTMKAKQLRRLVREMINETINLREDEAADEAAEEAAKEASIKQLQALQQHKSTLSSTTVSPDQKPAQDAEIAAINKKIAYVQKKMQNLSQPGVSSLDINELARIAKGFQLSDPDVDTSAFANKKVSGVPLSDIIEYFRENPGTEKKQIQQHFKFVRPQITNALVNALMDSGILTKIGEEPTKAPVAGGEEDHEEEPEEDPLAAYFDNKPNTNGEEDFNDEEEPTVGDIEKTHPINVPKVSDEDFEDSLKYSELSRRLAATKGNILKLKRGKTTAGDLKDKPSSELQRLEDLKISLEKRINDLINKSDYVKKIAGGTPIAAPEPVIEPDEEEEEEPLDEWVMGKWQFYAGIKK